MEFENLSSEEIINLQINDVPSIISEKGLICLPPFAPLKSAALFFDTIKGAVCEWNCRNARQCFARTNWS